MLVFDLETDGLLDSVTKVHVLVTKDTDTGEVLRYGGPTNRSIEDGINTLVRWQQAGGHIGGHNVLRYDLPVMDKLYPQCRWDRRLVTDTIVLSTLVYPEIKFLDLKNRAKWGMPPNMCGRHSLEAWGYRLGLHKGDYSAQCKAKGIYPWEAWSQEMEDYCALDVEVTHTLLKLCEAKDLSPVAVCIEHRVADICFRQEQAGVKFNTSAAVALYASLSKKRSEVSDKLSAAMGSLYMQDGKVFIPKVDSKVRGYTAEVPFTKVKLTPLSPSSRMHIALWLKRKYSWSPVKFTEDGRPQVDESVLEGLPYPEIPLMIEYLLLDKRIGQIAEGKEAWLKRVCSKRGSIHGRVNTNAAVTARATHTHPNLGQVPASHSPYGTECRTLFEARAGKVLVGADLSGLELRCLGHYMAPFDGGEYGRTVCEGDIHTVNMNAAGLASRPQAKTFIYAFLYGAGNGKIGEIVGKGARAGGQLRERFLEQTPALDKLSQKVKRLAAKNKVLRGLDDRAVKVRSAHAALNTLLQSAGALIAKLSLVLFDDEVERRGWRGRVQQVLWIHDEIQVEVDKEIADEVGKVAVDAFVRAGLEFGFRVPITGEFKVGENWGATH